MSDAHAARRESSTVLVTGRSAASVATHHQLERYDAAELEAKLQRYPATRLVAADGGVSGQLTL